MRAPAFILRSTRILLAAAFSAAVIFPQVAAAQDAPDRFIRGVVLLPDETALRPEGVPVPPGEVDASRVLALTTPQAQTAIRAYLNQPINNVMLDSLRAAIGGYYEDIGRPFVTVDVPPQDVTSGALQIVVTEAVLGQVAVEGAARFDEQQYRDAFRLNAGGPIDNATLQADIDWINRNPYRQVTALASAGATPGATDITLRVQESRPLVFAAGSDNTGNRSTGLYRLFAGVDWGNAFGRGDIASYRYTTSTHTSRLQQHTGSYVAFLPWRDVLTVSGVLADSSSEDPLGLIVSGGRTGAIALRYEHPLPVWGAVRHGVSLGYDFKSTNNDILFGGASVFNSTTEINQLSFAYQGSRPDNAGSTSWTLQLVISPGGVTGLNTDAAFQTQRFGADSEYLYGVVSVERVTQFSDAISWRARGSLQLASEPLLASEQVSFGGPGSNRAFQASGATRDNGFQLSNDLRLANFQPGLPAALGISQGDQFMPLLFLDYGGGWNYDLGFGDDWLALASVGAGFEYRFAQYGSLRFTYGLPLIREGLYVPTLLPQFSAQLNF